MTSLVPTQCPSCGGSEIVWDQDTGEHCCSKCGLVIYEDLLDPGADTRVYIYDENLSRSRVGPGEDPTVVDRSGTTVFGIRDATGKKLKTDTINKMLRLNTIDNRSRHSSEQRNLGVAMGEMARMARILRIPKNALDHAAIIYRKSLRMNLIRGRSIECFCAACLYAACRLEGVPRTITDVCRSGGLEEKDMTRIYRLMLKEKVLVKVPFPDPLIHISSIAGKTGLNQLTQERAAKILREKRGQLVGKDPVGLAAAALYLASRDTREYRTQKSIADAAGTTEVTLRNRMKSIKQDNA